MKRRAFLEVTILFLFTWLMRPASASMYFVAYSVDENSLYRLSLGDMEPTKIGTLEIDPYPATSTWALVKASEDSAYMVERYSDTLYTVSLNDASTLLSVPLDRDVQSNGRGLDISPEGILYGLFAGNELRTIEPATGETTFVATVDIPLIESFAFAPDGTLYAGTDNGGGLYTIDVDTGIGSFIADTICPDIDALTYAPDGFLYAGDSSAGTVADLYRIDPLTGESFNLGSTGITELNGLLAIPEPAPRPILNITQDTYHETIEAAVDEATTGDTIMVPIGTYSGLGNRDVDFKGKAITLRSEDPNDPTVVAATVIDCKGTLDDPHRGFYFHSGEDANSVLEGFTITNGYGPNEPFGASDYSAGGAIYCNNSSPTIRNCVIRNNYSNYWGGGIWFDNSNAVIENCIFQENTALDTGGGLYNRLSSITIRKCQFMANSGPYGGGIYNIDGTSSVRNTLFIGNLAAINGGGLRNKRVVSTIANCTFVDNQAPAGAAVHNVLSEGTTITNCILWGNPATGIEDDAEVTYCDVEGSYPGEGNIDADPCFADTAGGDYHLKSQAGRWDPDSKTWVKDDVTSPCIDAGDPSSAIGWEPYPNGGIVNMGIYGGTQQASKSYFGGPVCQKPIAGDANGDCRVDFRDFMIMALHWCEDNNP